VGSNPGVYYDWQVYHFSSITAPHELVQG
jgi:hypothetical protein